MSSAFPVRVDLWIFLFGWLMYRTGWKHHSHSYPTSYPCDYRRPGLLHANVETGISQENACIVLEIDIRWWLR